MQVAAPLPPRPPAPPTTVDELMTRARALAGRTLADLARANLQRVPPDLRRHKGWVGNTVEIALGASAGSKPHPDFEHLGIELKTLPIGADGRPRESTFVCQVGFDDPYAMRWETSHARRKLACVLWVPVQAAPEIPLADRRVGGPLLWHLGGSDEARIRADWERVVALVRVGQLDAITAHLGEVLQVRPKAADRHERRETVGEDGWLVPAQPRGFYLRSSFTSELIARGWA